MRFKRPSHHQMMFTSNLIYFNELFIFLFYNILTFIFRSRSHLEHYRSDAGLRKSSVALVLVALYILLSG